jgi:hypothetical protein
LTSSFDRNAVVTAEEKTELGVVLASKSELVPNEISENISTEELNEKSIDTRYGHPSLQKFSKLGL